MTIEALEKIINEYYQERIIEDLQPISIWQIDGVDVFDQKTIDHDCIRYINMALQFFLNKKDWQKWNEFENFEKDYNPLLSDS